MLASTSSTASVILDNFFFSDNFDTKIMLARIGPAHTVIQEIVHEKNRCPPQDLSFVLVHIHNTRNPPITYTFKNHISTGL